MASFPSPRSLRLPPAASQVIDRSKEIEFTFDGKPYKAHPGDTIASALAAAGVRTFSRSFKYHRRRGLLCVSGDCPNCLVQVGGEPNVRSCRRNVEPGMSVRAQNAWPSLQLDVMSLTQLVSRFLPPGFYYKAFMRPRALWPVYERVLRGAAGLGKVDPQAKPEAFHKHFLHADVAVVGGGPAGMRAAMAAAGLGARVVLMDEGDQLGGLLRYRRGPDDGEALQARAQALVAQIGEQDRLQVLEGTTVVGWYEGNWMAAVQGERLIKLRARTLVVATGATEIPATFENSELPGVMLGAGAQRLLHLWGVRPGDRAVVVSGNSHGPRVALDLVEAGIAVPALVGVADGDGPVGRTAKAAHSENAEALERLRDAGTEVIFDYQVTRARGRQQVEALEIAQIGGGQPRSIDCDLVILSTGLSPANQLLRQAGAVLAWDPTTRQHLPASLPQHVFAAGGAAGTHRPDDAEMEGKLAGMQAALAAGFGEGHARREADELEAQVRDRRAERRPWSIYPILHHGWPSEDGPTHAEGKVGEDEAKPALDVSYWQKEAKHQFVCLCEDVSSADILQSVQEGYDSSELLKRYSTVSMGPCQGRMCDAAVMHLCARFTAQPLAKVSATTSRPPIRPVKMGNYAGRLLEPTRLTPMHDWHVGHGARMMVAGAWMRPEHYGDPDAEVRAVRQQVGLIDVSTLGKLHLHGPQVAELLELIYTNRWRKLEIGRVRYGLMVNEEGVVMDDGVTARLGEDFFYMTTTSGGAAGVHEWIEWWLQSSRPLAVHVVNATEMRAAMNLTGPRARQVLSRIVDGTDLSPTAFPYLHARQARVAGVPALLMRIGFTGELGFEIHVPSGYGQEVWEALMRAGEEFGIRPFGVEAQRMLRLEKGHIIIGQDTDGLSNPLEAGLGWAVKLDKEDFLGKPALVRAHQRGDQQRLVGFEMVAGGPPEEADQIVQPGEGPLGLEIIGRVTSARYSSTLDRALGLCWLPAAQSQPGTQFTVRVRRSLRKARVVELPFYDPEGKRLRA